MLQRIANTPFQFTKFIFGLGLFIGLLFLVGYIGATIYSNLTYHPGQEIEPPDAEYSLTIENTGLTLYTNEYTQQGVKYELKGFWQLEVSKYRYYKETLTLEEDNFGPIKIRRLK